MQKLENKEIILLALYGEYIKDEGHFDLIRPQTVNMSVGAFRWAVMKLQTEELVDGVYWTPKDTMNPDKVLAICWDNIHLTRAGVTYAEELIEAKGKQRKEKILKLAEVFGGLALDALRSMLLKQLD